MTERRFSKLYAVILLPTKNSSLRASASYLINPTSFKLDKQTKLNCEIVFVDPVIN